MNTATMTIGNPKTGVAKPRHGLEELVDRLMATLTFPDDPEPDAVVDTHHDLVRQPRGRLEELVDRLMATLTFRVEPEMTPVAASSDLVRAIHQSRRHRQKGNLDGALQTLAGAAPVSAAPQQTRWAFTEWKQLVSRRFGHPGPLGLQPGSRQGRRPGAPQRRLAGGDRRVGNVLESGQACIPTQPEGPEAPRIKHGAGSGDGLPLIRGSHPFRWRWRRD